MALKAKKPEEIKKRLKLFMYGPAGVGKTTAALQFPHAYMIDCEKGADNYFELIKRNGSVIIQTNDVDDIVAELKSLLTEKHEYRTLIIDPITILYEALQERWNARFETQARGNGKTEAEIATADWGVRYWGKVKAEHKRINNLIMRLDMNVIMTSHQKIDFKTLATTFDAMKGMDYFFDTIFQLTQIGGKRLARTVKDRSPDGKPRFPDSFEWQYDSVANFFGRDIIEAPAHAVVLATVEQVAQLERLLTVVRLDDGVTDKWLDKAQATTWAEMEPSQIAKCITHCEKLIDKAGATTTA